MKIGEAFKHIKLGVNPNKLSIKPNYIENIFVFKKEGLQACSLLSRYVEEKTVYICIDRENFLQKKDIIISLKKPYRAAFIEHPRDNLLLPSNFAVLRGIDEEKYDYIFITHYLEYIIFKEMLERIDSKDELSLKDIRNIELPDIPLEKQLEIHNLLHLINNRNLYFNAILDNDIKIVKSILKKVTSDNDVQ